MKSTSVTQIDFYKMCFVVYTRKPIGKFYCKSEKHSELILNDGSSIYTKSDKNFIVCDNSNGDAKINQFEYLEDGINWLNNKI